MKLRTLCTLCILAIVAGFTRCALANPAFARQFNTSCFTCHTSPPLLNEFGRRFQANGYQLPGTTDRTAQPDQPVFPLGIVVTPMVMHTQVHDNLTNAVKSKATSIAGIMMRVFSAGSLGEHFGYYVGVPVTVASGETTVEIETIQLIANDLLSDGQGSLNFRVGKFLLLVPNTPMFLLSGEDPLVFNSMVYKPTSEKTVANDLNLTTPVFGASAFGTLYGIGQGLRWEAAVTGGNNSDIDLGASRAFYLALDQTLFVQNAPMRLGAFYFGGMQHLSNTVAQEASGHSHSMSGMTSAAAPLSNPWENHVSRLGFDAEIYDPWTKRFIFSGLFMLGHDDNIDSMGIAYDAVGGFAGLTAILSPEKLYAFARYDWLQRSPRTEDYRTIDLGLRYHFLPNVQITAGASIQNTMLRRTIHYDAYDRTTTTYRVGMLYGF